jgi:hypothetical protein
MLYRRLSSSFLPPLSGSLGQQHCNLKRLRIKSLLDCSSLRLYLFNHLTKHWNLCRFAIPYHLDISMDGMSHSDTSRHSDFAALRHDVLKRFKGASLYKVVQDLNPRICRLRHPASINLYRGAGLDPLAPRILEPCFLKLSPHPPLWSGQLCSRRAEKQERALPRPHPRACP